MNTLEKMARAICQASITDPHTIDPEDLPGLIDQWWHDSAAAARAALEAMKYCDSEDEELFASISAGQKIDAVLFICGYDEVIQAALDGK